MGGRGVLFAIDEAVAESLRALHGDDDAVMDVIESVEEAWDKDALAETDKAWDAIHRALTDGDLTWDGGSYPLSHAILGGERVYEGEDYIAVLKTPEQVRDIATGLGTIDEAEMGRRYDSIVPRDYAPEYGAEDRRYTIDWYEGVRDLYVATAKAGRWVLFTVDQ